MARHDRNDLPPAVVYCAHCLDRTRGKTAHGLVRRSERFDVCAVVDPDHAGKDASDLVPGAAPGIPIVSTLQEALAAGPDTGEWTFIVGLATDGGVLPDHAREAVKEAIGNGMHVVSGLHVFLSEDPEIAPLARAAGVRLEDVRRPPDRKDLHFYQGRVREIEAVRVLVLGTDCATGKRTTSWIIRDALIDEGVAAEMIGTGQTAWMQGARYSIVLDSLVNDFVAGELEHAMVSAWSETGAEVLIVEGQGALLHPAYPGGLELIAAVQPDVIVLQIAAGKDTFDGFPDLPLPPLERQIAAIEILADRPVDILSVNPAGRLEPQRAWICGALERDFDRPVIDIMRDGPGRIVEVIRGRMRS
ncbi:MAG: DUF1611 domain-containing protein [Rhodothermales bacterium]|nr:DUF1611 domain-containing protein [Rhodothermales bacterium]